MKKLSRFLAVYVFICVFSTLPLLYAGSVNTPQAKSKSRCVSHGMRMRPEDKRRDIFRKLNLTQEQKKLLDENKVKDRDKVRTLLDKMRSHRETLKQELMKKELDMKKINEIQSYLKTIESDMTDQRLDSILKVREILTPEQFEEFISLTGKKDKKPDKKPDNKF